MFMNVPCRSLMDLTQFRGPASGPGEVDLELDFLAVAPDHDFDLVAGLVAFQAFHVVIDRGDGLCRRSG